MKKLHLLTGALAVLGLYSVSAQELSIDAEIRPRAEILNGFGEPALGSDDPGAVISQRTALKFKYKSEKITSFIQLQDVSVWGDRPQLETNDGSSFRIQQAWAKLDLGKGFSAKIGRQELSYDDQRILGGLGWAQQARTHDVGLFSYVDEGLKIDAGFGFNQNRENIVTRGLTNTDFTPSNPGIPIFQYKGIGFLHLNNKFSDSFTGSFLFLGNSFQNGAGLASGDETPGFNNRYTSGVHLKYKKSGFSASANGYYQFGEIFNPLAGGIQDVSGYLASLDLTYKPGKTLFGLGYEYISGDDRSSEGDFEGFFPLFGTNHKFNGFMDYFYVGNHAFANGLQDINAKVVLKTGTKSTLMIKAHQFLGAEDVAGLADNFGTEIDLVFKTPVVKGATLIVGYSQAFLDDDFLANRRVTPGTESDIQAWAWTMLVIKPNLFKWKKEIK